MGDENNVDFQSAMAQAPPFAANGQDIDAQKAAQDAQAATRVASALTPQGTASAPAPGAGPRPVVPPVAAGSFGDKLSLALNNAKAGADQAMLQEPGGWSKLMIGATMDALSGGPARPAPETAPTAGPGSSNFQGDATAPTAAAQMPPADRTTGQKVNDRLSDLSAAQGPGGLIGGLSRTAKAQNEREREQMKDKLQMAVSNAQMIHEQALTHKLGDDAMLENVTTGKAAIASMTAAPPNGGSAGTLDSSGKTSDELNKMIQDGVFHPSTQTAFPDGRIMEGKDANGLPIWRTTYSVVTPPASMSLGKNADLINEQLGMKLKPDQVLPGTQVNALLQQANTAKVNSDARELAAKKQGLENQQVDDEIGMKAVDKNPRITQVLDAVSVPGKNNEIDAYAPIKAYNYMKANGGFEKFGTTEGAARLWAGNGSAKGFDTMNENFAKEQQKTDTKANDIISKVLENPSFLENDYNAAIAAAQAKVNSKDPAISQKDRKDAADVLSLATQVKADKAAEKAAGKEKDNPYEGDESLTGEAFLNSLPSSSRGTVKAIGEGRAPILNLGYLASRKPEVLDAVTKAYPGFDGAKIKDYVDTNKDFTSGKTSVALNAGGTAMGHLAELRNLNTAASHIPHTPAWTAYQNKVDTLATELAKFYGDATVPAIASIKETLASTLPGNREAAIKTQAQSMGDKLEAFEQTWKNAAPSPAYEAPLPFISTKAKQAFASLNPEYALSHPEYAPGQQGGVPTPAAKAAAKSLPPAPAGQVSVQIPGFAPGFVSADKLKAFQLKHPNAVVSQ